MIARQNGGDPPVDGSEELPHRPGHIFRRREPRRFVTALLRRSQQDLPECAGAEVRRGGRRIQREPAEPRERHLDPGVQIVGPITSTYRWQGKIETADEWQCWAKSRGELYEKIEAAIRRLHPYDVPEILALPVVASSSSYLKWLDDEVKGA